MLGVDADNDLAVLSVETSGAAAVSWAKDSVNVGSPVVALGNPAGAGARVTFGFVSGVGRAFRGPRGRRIGGSLEHTAPLMPGSSGGPLVNVAGELLGINTNRLGSGFYLAIPRTPVCARASTRWAAARRLRGVTWASAWHRRTSPDGCDGQSACPSATACWSAKSRTTPPPRGPVSPRAT